MNESRGEGSQGKNTSPDSESILIARVETQAAAPGIHGSGREPNGNGSGGLNGHGNSANVRYYLHWSWGSERENC